MNVTPRLLVAMIMEHFVVCFVIMIVYNLAIKILFMESVNTNTLPENITFLQANLLLFVQYGWLFASKIYNSIIIAIAIKD